MAVVVPVAVAVAFVEVETVVPVVWATQIQ
jgi:hypothetical protein